MVFTQTYITNTSSNCAPITTYISGNQYYISNNTGQDVKIFEITQTSTSGNCFAKIYPDNFSIGTTSVPLTTYIPTLFDTTTTAPSTYNNNMNWYVQWSFVETDPAIRLGLDTRDEDYDKREGKIPPKIYT